jgi:hypothetical protein
MARITAGFIAGAVIEGVGALFASGVRDIVYNNQEFVNINIEKAQLGDTVVALPVINDNEVIAVLNGEAQANGVVRLNPGALPPDTLPVGTPFDVLFLTYRPDADSLD